MRITPALFLFPSLFLPCCQGRVTLHGIDAGPELPGAVDAMVPDAHSVDAMVGDAGLDASTCRHSIDLRADLEMDIAEYDIPGGRITARTTDTRDDILTIGPIGLGSTGSTTRYVDPADGVYLEFDEPVTDLVLTVATVPEATDVTWNVYFPSMDSGSGTGSGDFPIDGTPTLVLVEISNGMAAITGLTYVACVPTPATDHARRTRSRSTL
jgi:hypothetical protein